jgi:hypothetical protein
MAHLRGVAVHTIELFNFLLPDMEKSTIALLVTNTVNRIFDQIDSEYKWNLSVRPNDEAQ